MFTLTYVAIDGSNLSASGDSTLPILGTGGRLIVIVQRVLVAIVCVTISLTGCSTMKPVNLATDQPISTVLQPNDFVRVWMHDGRVIEMRLTAVERDALVSGEQRLPIKDIERVERLSFSAGRTALLVLGICATVVVAIASWFATHPAPI